MKIAKIFLTFVLLVPFTVVANEEALDIEELVKQNAKYERMIERLVKKLERIQQRKDRNGNTPKWLETMAEVMEMKVDQKKKKYREWKDEAERAVKSSSGVKIHVGNDLNPCINWYNYDYPQNTCNAREESVVSERLGKLMNGILAARDFNDVVWETMIADPGPQRRNLRASQHQRQLQCPWCPRPTYQCAWICGGRRRRMQEEETPAVDESPSLYEESIQSAENRIAELKPVLEEQCRKLLGLIAIDAEPAKVRKKCKQALLHAECTAHFSVESLVAIEGPDGKMETAEEYIAAEEAEEEAEEIEEGIEETEEVVEETEEVDEGGVP